MENSNERMTCEQARKFDMVNYLASLGYHPKNVRGNNYWYFSPFRDEKSPSFKIDRKLNVWADFGDDVPPGKKVSGGNLVDFAVRYHRCSIGEFLNSMERLCGMPVAPKATSRSGSKDEDEEGKLHIVKDIPLEHPALLKYISSRRIPFSIANDFCREVHFTIRDKPYFAVGFKNDVGGYELRNSFFKGSSSPKGATLIRESEQATEICVIEGFFSFLSYMTLVPSEERQGKDTMVLNSLVFFETARPCLESYNNVNLFLDNNAAGRKVTAYARSLDKRLYKDRSDLYRGYDDFNHFHAHFGESKKKGLRHSR